MIEHTEWKIKSNFKVDLQTPWQNLWTINISKLEVSETYLIFASEEDLIKDEEIYDFFICWFNQEMCRYNFSHLSGLHAKLKHILTDALNQMMIIP